MDSPPAPAADKSADSLCQRNTPARRGWSGDRQLPPGWLFRPNRPALDLPAHQINCYGAPDEPVSQSSRRAAPRGLRTPRIASGSTEAANYGPDQSFGASFRSEEHTSELQSL